MQSPRGQGGDCPSRHHVLRDPGGVGEPGSTPCAAVRSPFYRKPGGRSQGSGLSSQCRGAPPPPNSAHSSRFGCTDHPEIPWPDTTARAPQVPDRGGRGPWRSSETTAPRSQRPEWGGRPGPPLLLRGGGAQHAPVHLTKQPSTPDEERDPRAERSRGAWEEGLGRTAEAVGVQERVDQRARGWEGKGTRARSEAANRSSSKRTRRGGNEKIKVIINTISPTERQKLLVRTCAATRVALQF